jgi:hypothetical protein
VSDFNVSNTQFEESLSVCILIRMSKTMSAVLRSRCDAVEKYCRSPANAHLDLVRTLFLFVFCLCSSYWQRSRYQTFFPIQYCLCEPPYIGNTIKTKLLHTFLNLKVLFSACKLLQARQVRVQCDIVLGRLWSIWIEGVRAKQFITRNQHCNCYWWAGISTWLVNGSGSCAVDALNILLCDKSKAHCIHIGKSFMLSII